MLQRKSRQQLRTVMRRWVTAGLVVALATPLAAQRPYGAGLWLGGAIGQGSGPTPSAFAGGSLVFDAASHWSVAVEVSHVHQGVGVGCIQTVPGSLDCAYEGTTLLGGPGIRAALVGPVSAYGALLGGPYISRFLDGTTPAAEVEMGARVSLGSRWRVHAGGRFLKAFNPEYKRELRKDLHYLFWDVGLELRLLPGP